MENISKKTSIKVEPIFDIQYAEFYQPVRMLGTVKNTINKSVASLTYDATSQLLFVTTPDNKKYLVPFTNISAMEYV